MKVTRTSQVSGKVRTLDLPITIEQLTKWQNGGLIQNIMPQLTPAQREFLITGITDDEWTELFGDEEEDEDEETIGCRNTMMEDIEIREIEEYEINKDKAIEDAQDYTPY